MNEIGIVTAVDSDYITVHMKRTKACSRCGLCMRVSDSDDVQIVAKNECNAVVNDRVRLKLVPEAFLKATLILYGLPLLGFITGCIVGALINPEAWVAFLCGVTMAGMMYGVIKKLENNWNSKRHIAVAVKVV